MEPSIPAEAHGIDAPRPVVEAPALTPEAAVHTLYGLASGLLDRLADATGEDREQALSQVLH